MRKELKLRSKTSTNTSLIMNVEEEKDSRSLLGTSGANNWIEEFNIGSLMHMNSLSYDNLALFGEPSFEIS